MKKAFAWSLILSITLMLCACTVPPATESETGNIQSSGKETTATELSEELPEAVTPADSSQTAEDTTEPAQVTSPEATAAPQLQDWKRAYLEFLEGVNDYHVGFALVYIDGDDIPELYLNGDCEATGDAVCTYKNGKVLEERLKRIWGGSYIPGAGLVKNTNGNMGYYTTDIYSLTANGFTVIWNGLETQEVIPPANENEEPTMIISFSIGDQTVSEEEYYAAIEAVFNTSQAVLLHENTLSYDAVRQLILDS